MDSNSSTGGNGQAVLTGSDSFQFACNDGLPCFTQCCRDVNIYLTPYDVLRLRRALKIGSHEFLTTYTRTFLLKDVNIPAVQFAMDPDTLYCKLVTPEGCKVYEDRPWACRMFPLDTAGQSGQYCIFYDTARCMGLSEPNTWKVDEWLAGQGVDRYVEIEAVFQALIPPPDSPVLGIGPGLGRLLFLAYDLDQFDKLLDDKSFLDLNQIDEGMVRTARENDEEMLLLAYRHIRAQMDYLMRTSS